MKKTLIVIFVLLVAILGITYTLAFTQMGNNLLKPLVESKLNQYSPIPLRLEVFSLRPSKLKIFATHNDSLDIKMMADFSLWNQSFRGNLLAVGKNPSSEMKAFHLKSSFKGNIYNFVLGISSDIASSQTHIQAKIKSFEVQELQAKITALKLNELLTLLEKTPYASGNVNIEANLKGSLETGINGNLKAEIQQGKIHPELAKKYIHIDIPKSIFSLQLKADFDNKLIKNNLKFISNFGNINTSGQFKIPNLEIDNKFDISLSDIAPLGILVAQNIRGGLNSKGTLKGNKNNIHIQGFSDIANSDTKYSFNLNNFVPEKIRFNVRKISIEKLLWMLDQPQYIKGQASFMGNISNLKSLSISGRAKANTNPNIIKKHFHINVPDEYFTVQTGAMITNGVGNFDFNVESAIGYFRLQNGDVNINDKYADGTYQLLIRDLSNLKGIAGREMNGKIEANGNIKYDKIFSIDFQSTSLGGKINGRANPKDLYVNFDGVGIKKILDTLEIPAILNGTAQGDLNYNLISQKGKISASIKDGKIIHTQIGDVFNKYAGIDVNAQIFDGANFFSDIDNGKLDGKLSMQSDDIEIDSQYLKVDMTQNTIHSKFKFSSHQNYIYLLLDGNIHAPKTQVDVSDFIKNHSLKNIQNNTQKAIEKFIPTDKQEKTKKMLGEIFKKL